MKVSIVIPCYNEEGNVALICNAIKDILFKELPEYDYEILLIDNKSKDNTRDKIRLLCAKDKRIKAIFNVKNFGQFNSPFYGMLQSSGDCTIHFCADFQDPVEMIPVMIREWEKGHKIIAMIKTSSKENKLLYFFRSIYYKLISVMSTEEQIQHFTGFGLYDRSFIDILRKLNDPTP